MIETFIDHYKAIEIKTGLKANGIIGTIEEWVAELPDGSTIDNHSIIPEEVQAAKIIREAEKVTFLENRASEKAALLAKLGISENEAKLLLS